MITHATEVCLCKIMMSMDNKVSKRRKTHPNSTPERGVVSREIVPGFNGHSNPAINGFPVRPAIHGTSAQKR